MAYAVVWTAVTGLCRLTGLIIGWLSFTSRNPFEGQGIFMYETSYLKQVIGEPAILEAHRPDLQKGDILQHASGPEEYI